MEQEIKDILRINLIKKTLNKKKYDSVINWDQLLDVYMELERNNKEIHELTNNIYYSFHDHFTDNIDNIISSSLNNEISNIDPLDYMHMEDEVDKLYKLIRIQINKDFFKEVNEIKKFDNFKTNQ